MSVVLTVVSLGTRVALAYVLSALPALGASGIWWSVPIGWVLADVTGLVYYKVHRRSLLNDCLADDGNSSAQDFAPAAKSVK